MSGLRQGLESQSRRSGQPPGALVHVGDRPAQETRIQAVDYDADHVDERPLADLAEAARLKRTPAVTWLDITGLRDTSVLEQIGTLYGVHPLILEDILNTEQRPRLEVFDDYLFLSVKMIQYQRDTDALDIDNFSVIVGRDFLISFQERETGALAPLRERLRSNKGRLRRSGPDLLAHALLDAIVDGYFAVLEGLGERVEDLEERLVSPQRHPPVEEVHRLKRELLLLRRSMWPLREVIGGLMREESALVSPDTTPYLRDVYDHTIELIDTLEILRDMATGLMDLYLSSVSNRMNEVMKVLTIIATIFIPLTFITGIYGMNFEAMPELRMRWGYPAVLLLCALIGGGMLAVFWRRRWL